jgi:hypothetical protein
MATGEGAARGSGFIPLPPTSPSPSSASGPGQVAHAQRHALPAPRGGVQHLRGGRHPAVRRRRGSGGGVWDEGRYAAPTLPGRGTCRWELATGADIVIPRSVTPAHQAQNLALFTPGSGYSFTMAETDVATVSSLSLPYSKVYHTDVRPRRLRGWACLCACMPRSTPPPPMFCLPMKCSVSRGAERRGVGGARASYLVHTSESAPH